jgi:hypothetical protein
MFRYLNGATVYSDVRNSRNAEFDIEYILLTQLPPKVHSVESFLPDLAVQANSFAAKSFGLRVSEAVVQPSYQRERR